MISSAVFNKAGSLSSPLTKGGLRGVLPTNKNLPQPLLVKEGAERSSDLSGSGTRTQSTLVTCLVIVCSVLVAVPDTATAQTPADEFVKRLGDFSELSPKATELIRTTWSTCDDCDGAEFLTQGLAVLSPTFRDGLDAYDDDRYAQAATIMHGLSSDDNVFLSINASAYEIKALVQGERVVEALARTKALLKRSDELARYSYFDAEMHFLHGFGLLANLQYTEAAEALERFLKNHPDASQRLTVAAQQMLVELMNRQPGQIGEVVDLMSFCERRLRVADSGDTVQKRQDRVIDILDRMIEEAEEKEKQQSGEDSGGGGGGGQDQGKNSPSSPMQESSLPGGSSGEGELRAKRYANPAEVWGAMPPADRAKVLQALRDSFPSRYRRLVEQYYEELAKKP